MDKKSGKKKQSPYIFLKSGKTLTFHTANLTPKIYTINSYIIQSKQIVIYTKLAETKQTLHQTAITATVKKTRNTSS